MVAAFALVLPEAPVVSLPVLLASALVLTSAVLTLPMAETEEPEPVVDVEVDDVFVEVEVLVVLPAPPAPPVPEVLASSPQPDSVEVAELATTIAPKMAIRLNMG